MTQGGESLEPEIEHRVENRTELIKASAAIHIQNKVTLLQRRTWNVLLAYAYDDLPTEEEYHMPVRDLIEVLEFNSKNEDYLKESLEAIVGCKVKWNLLGKDKLRWGVTTLLSQALLEDGICTWAYSPVLRKNLHNPQIFARISLSLQNKFESKHALALWEICIEALNASADYGQTDFVPLETFREMMSISDEMYPMFKLFNKRVIKGPIEEINRRSDFHVTVEYKRKGRKVVAVQFKIRRMQQVPAQSTTQKILPFPELHDMPLSVKMLKDAGLANHDAWEIWQQGFDYVDAGKRPDGVKFETYVGEKIHLLKSQETGKVKNQTGFLLAAIKQNYANPGFAASQKAKAASQKVQADVIKDKELKKLHEEKEEAEREKQETIGGICARMIDDTPELVDPIMHMILEEDRGYRIVYDSSSSPLDNYREHVFLRMRVNTELVQQYPDRFAAVQKEHEERIANLERRIAAAGG